MLIVRGSSPTYWWIFMAAISLESGCGLQEHVKSLLWNIVECDHRSERACPSSLRSEPVFDDQPCNGHELRFINW